VFRSRFCDWNSSAARKFAIFFVTYSETLLAQIQQTAACNALHTTKHKIRRWLLMMDDRADAEDLTFAHEFLAGVLGITAAR
jgi:hypothetical protein